MMPTIAILSSRDNYVVGPTTLVYDTFTDSDSTALTAHTPDIDVVGGGWVAYVSTICQVLGNKAGRTAAARSVSAINAGVANTLLTCDVSAINQGGIVCRLSDNANYWLFYCQDSNLYEVVAGAFTVRANVSTVGVPVAMKVVSTGASISINYNNAAAATYASATHNQTATRYGIFVDSSTQRFDNFTVTTL